MHNRGLVRRRRRRPVDKGHRRFGCEVRCLPRLGEPHHFAYVVDDIEATVRRLVAQLGAGPFFLIEHVPLETVRSRGEPAEFVHNSAFDSCGGGAIELDDRGLMEYLSSHLGGVEATVHDASATFGHDVEIHVANEGLRGFFGMVRAAADGWDGSAPLRPLET